MTQGDDSLLWHVMQAMWVQFAPSAAVADAASWQMYKLGRPISPLEVVYNGSQSMHAVSDEGISVQGAGKGTWEQLNIRSDQSPVSTCVNAQAALPGVSTGQCQA